MEVFEWYNDQLSLEAGNLFIYPANYAKYSELNLIFTD